MLALPLHGLGVQGVDKYTARENLPVTKLAVCRNCRSFKGKIETAPGLTAFVSQTLDGRPLGFLWWQRNDLQQILTAVTTTKLYRFNTATLVFDDRSHSAGDYTGGSGNFWDFVAFNGNAYFTNGLETIQKENGESANVTDISGSGAPLTALTLGQLQTYLVAAYVDGDSRKIQWPDTGSDSVWNSGDAGNLSLYQDPGEIYKILNLGEFGVVYRPWGIHILFYIGPPFIFAQRQVVSRYGIIGKRAVAEFGQARHAYWSWDGFYLFDGVTPQRFGQEVFDAVMEDIDPQWIQASQVFVNIKDREIFFAYPKSGDDGVCKQAAVWNYQDNTWEHPREFTVTTAGPWRRFQDITWDTAVGTWAGTLGSWLEQVKASDSNPVVLVGTDAGAVRFLDRDVVNEAGTARTRRIETALFNPSSLLWNRQGEKATLNRIDIDQENKGSYNLEVYVGTQNVLRGDADITWSSTYTLAASGATRSIPVRHTGVYFAFRIQTTGVSQPFRLSRLTGYFVPRGAHA